LPNDLNSFGTATGITSPAFVPLVTPAVSNSISSVSDQPINYVWHGVDTLHLGIHVEWGPVWRELTSYLAAMKVRAYNTEGMPASWGAVGGFIVLPRGLARRYSFHVKHPTGNFFITNTPAPVGFPNVMCWVDNRMILKLGLTGATAAVTQVINGFGGCVTQIVPSRVDLFADFYIRDGLTFNFLQSKRVGKKQKVRSTLDGDVLETYALGTEGASISARIYDKGKQLLKHGDQRWICEAWNNSKPSNIWRVEFQLLRPILHDFGVDSVDDILAKCGGIWSYLTKDWVSFRNRDNGNKSRRTIDPWWEVVQSVATRFGLAVPIKRRLKGSSVPSKDQYVRLIAGCLPGYAARTGNADLRGAVDALMRDVRRFFTKATFDEKYRAKRAALGISDQPTDGKVVA
jgi:hypothetical protein